MSKEQMNDEVNATARNEAVTHFPSLRSKGGVPKRLSDGRGGDGVVVFEQMNIEQGTDE